MEKLLREGERRQAETNAKLAGPRKSSISEAGEGEENGREMTEGNRSCPEAGHEDDLMRSRLESRKNGRNIEFVACASGEPFRG